MRWIANAAWLFSFVTFLLSLVTLVTQLPGNKNHPLVIATFNTSYFGLAEYHDRSSPLNQNISALVPFAGINSPSITRYLGIKDWYSMSYLSTCSGYYASSRANPRLLSTSKVNVTCSKQSLGYTFSLSKILQNDIEGSAEGVVREASVKFKDYKTKTWVSLWIVGVITAFVDVLLLPFAWDGTNRLNMYTFLSALISCSSLFISASLVTSATIPIARDDLGTHSTKFRELIWISATFMLATYLLAAIEWQFEWWTPKGERIVIYWKPKHISWFDLRPARRTPINWDARRGL